MGIEDEKIRTVQITHKARNSGLWYEELEGNIYDTCLDKTSTHYYLVHQQGQPTRYKISREHCIRVDTNMKRNRV
jgi:hypothetical protein